MDLDDRDTMPVYSCCFSLPLRQLRLLFSYMVTILYSFKILFDVLPVNNPNQGFDVLIRSIVLDVKAKEYLTLESRQKFFKARWNNEGILCERGKLQYSEWPNFLPYDRDKELKFNRRQGQWIVKFLSQVKTQSMER